MVFKRLLGSLGVGGPAVDTVLDPGPVTPGGPLGGQVLLTGGGGDVTIEHVTLELVARVEAEHGDGESEGLVVFHQHVAGGNFRLAEGERTAVPFTFPLPWETPPTELYGQGLGIVLGVRTELGVAGARDKGDLDPLTVRPLPVQEAVLDAFGRLGFGFRSADLELGRVGGTGQRLPFYQEIELTPAPGSAHRFREVELTFVAGAAAMEVVLEAGAHDTLARFTVGHDAVDRTDWVAVVDGWLQELAGRAAPQPYGGHHADAHDGHHSDAHHGHHDGHHGGFAAGAAGLAAGFVGGMVAAEVVDEVGDFFEDDEDDEADEE
ncbi:sporulation protein [Streptomyces sp. NPDC090025]|uniref:sporulation protein n=1 Tax=Streptomyces sp. NPDC090025 TaxID=3365922 RepID=UPI003834328D